MPDLPDHRDFAYSAPLATLRRLPAKSDLRPGCPEVYDQGQLGSCTANAIGAAIEFDQKKERLASRFQPSRLFIYYNERVIEGTVNQDSGAQIRDGIKSVAKLGACRETIWPYDPRPYPPNPHLALKPAPSCYAEARRHLAIEYRRVPRTLAQMKGCLASGYPFIFGFTIYASFEAARVTKTGVVPMPGPREAVVGGHAVLAVGHDDATERFLAQSSWGTRWGIRGYFTMPYAYLLDGDLADDFWTIRLVS